MVNSNTLVIVTIFAMILIAGFAFIGFANAVFMPQENSLTGMITGPGGQNITQGCIDSDNGKTYTVNGSVVYSKDAYNYCVFPDACVGNSAILKEYYCLQGTVRYIYYDCGNLGCNSGKCGGTSTPNDGVIRIGDRVRVVSSTDCVNARDAPSLSSNALFCHPAGDNGTVIDGPQTTDGLKFWKINYDYNADGWSRELYLEKISGGSCQSSCSGKSCGNDGCGGSCGTCGTGFNCNNSTGICINTTACTAKTCTQLNKTCGTWSDQCTGTINCPTCTGGQTCDSTGQCQTTDIITGTFCTPGAIQLDCNYCNSVGSQYLQDQSKCTGGKTCGTDGYCHSPVTFSANSYHVFPAPTGKSTGDGSLSKPWDLQTALNQPSKVQPGDTIWLHGGVYPGVYASHLKGTASSPIRVRQAPGERATLKSDDTNHETFILGIYGQYTWFQDFEITTANTRRISYSNINGDTSYPNDLELSPSFGYDDEAYNAPGNKLINLIIHDTRGGGSQTAKRTEPQLFEANGCLIYNEGWVANGEHGHGHCLYGQNNNGPQTYKNNICWGGFSEDLQLYGTSNAKIDNMLGDRNFLLGSSAMINNGQVTNNVFYYRDIHSNNVKMGYGGGINGLTFRNNYIVGASIQFDTNMPNSNIGSNEFHVNSVEGISQSTLGTGDTNFPSSKPTQNKYFVYPMDSAYADNYEPRVGTIAIMNWQHSDSVSVPVSNLNLVSGATYRVRNVENYWNDIVNVQYTGNGYLTIPMTGHTTVVMPQGNWDKQMTTTFPEFGAFIIEKNT